MKKILLTLLLTLSFLTSIAPVMAKDGQMTLKEYSEKAQKGRILILKKLFDKVKVKIEEKKDIKVEMSSLEAAKAADSCLITMSEDKDFQKELDANEDRAEVPYTFVKCLRMKIQENLTSKK